MKTSFTPQEIKITFCTVTSSLLLCSSMEVQAASAEDETTPLYNQELPGLTLPASAPPYPGRSRVNPDLQSSRLTVEDASPSAWDHVYGKTSRQAQTDSLAQGSSIPGSSEFKGPALLTVQSNSGHTQRVGLIGGTTQFQGNDNGLLTSRALADPGHDTLNLQGQSLGAYWSLTGPQGWHVDLSASGGRVNGYSRNDQGARQAAEGSAVTLSVEGGFPIGLGNNWVIEPQAQLINQRITLDTPNAGSGNASSSDLTSWSGRVGARLKGSYDINGLPVEPYVRTNVWHTVYTGNTVSLDQVDKISSSRKSSTVDVGLGLVAKVTPLVSLYISADYSSDVDDNDLNGLIGSLGVRMRW
ncbi:MULTISPECIES: autotransporter domain-containing protein [Gammaproteobacteria]|uniref:Autotransporter outer membrane beta-barrel domain-containing protein n=1 Tax=Pseudomonas lini TaxID=163011 RepID=A0A423I9J6_9PSED|nr:MULTISPECIES: autotransporter outer membrane beta-barrel domain-containing protein [Gammaproteobacteria]MBK5301164.1 autotransporter outer membrane beta-barrel domain-containing protein [Bacillus sp. TH86]MBK5320933.1 autotransporter outer membrane beta-barrel domain-containing protein [Bacillus sp. TH59]MBK5335883.1 autotransporter outer membrane beta-barrel domain-containing protein [Bacillus sp. TH57]MBK5309960.1 autotransporter outer membrane beta-barrel domain-containing protein [Pseudo